MSHHKICRHCTKWGSILGGAKKCTLKIETKRNSPACMNFVNRKPKEKTNP